MGSDIDAAEQDAKMDPVMYDPETQRKIKEA